MTHYTKLIKQIKRKVSHASQTRARGRFIKRTCLRTFYYFCCMEIINYTEFRANLKHWFDKAINDVSDIVIKRKNGKDLVLIPLDEYNALKETTYLLTGKNREVLLKSVEELEAGKGIQNTLPE